ncbi:MAG TPA: hypothetical protein DDW65_14765, partial [Firmicutes bacterium]|nr:hypothetical protein [Bacillota bacterium]
MRKNLVIILGVSALLLMTIFHLALADNTEINSLDAKLEKYSKSKELSGLRTENSRTFLEKDGRRTVILANEPLNYQGDDGKLYPVDLNLASDKAIKNDTFGKNRFRHKSLKNTIKMNFAEKSADGLIVKQGNHQINFTLKHKYNRVGKITKNKIRYGKVFDNCDLQYTVLRGRVKEDLIFTSVPTTAIISYKVEFPGLRPQNGKWDRVNLVNQDGKIIFRILPSFMYEEGNEDEYQKIDTRFHYEKDQLYCDLILDMKWLKSKKRKYPVVVDPTTVSSAMNMMYGDTGDDSKLRMQLDYPERHSAVTAEVSVDGEKYHGHLGDNDYGWAYFMDASTGYKYFDFHQTNDYSNQCTLTADQLTPGHTYEIGVYGGNGKRFMGSRNYGTAWARLTYGSLDGNDPNDTALHLINPSEIPYFAQGYNTGIGGTSENVIQKEIKIVYPQEVSIKFSADIPYSGATGPSCVIRDADTGGAIRILTPANSGNTVTQHLEAGHYYLELTPQYYNNQWYHCNAVFRFPYLTKNYENQIIISTNPGYIDSSFRVPKAGNFVIEYCTLQNGSPSYQYLPRMVLYKDSTPTAINETFDLVAFNRIDGGKIVTLEAGQDYRLFLCRGRNGNTGWGSITSETRVYIPRNTMENHVTNLQIVDVAGKAVGNKAGCNDYIQFQYNDTESNPLTEYNLKVFDGSTTKTFTFHNLNIAPGTVTVPVALEDLGFTTGANVTYQIEGSWDGFDQSDSSSDTPSFVLDMDKPGVAIDSTNSKAKQDNTIVLQFNSKDATTDIQTQNISWTAYTASGQQQGSSGSLAATAASYTISELPANARVLVTVAATDAAGNTGSMQQTFYTYPKTALLMAPVAKITGNSGSGYRADLKVKKTAASYYRVQRFLKQGAELVADYDSGYIDSNSLSLMKAGPPYVSITSPWSDSSVAQPATINITAAAGDVDGTVTKVEFYADSTFLGSASGSPYSCTWKNVPAGTYSLTAKATDNDGLTTTSAPISVTVSNNAPTISIANQVTGTAGASDSGTGNSGTVTVNATAGDSDGSIAKVDFYVDGSKIGTDNSSPYSISFSWTYGCNSSHKITAVATDNNGGTATSDSVYVTYNQNCHTEYRSENHPYYAEECEEYCKLRIFGDCVDHGTRCWQVLRDNWVQVPYQVCDYSFTIINGTTTVTPTPTPTPGVEPSEPTVSTEDCYLIPDRPAQKHQSYVYRIWTKNGDHEVCSGDYQLDVVNNAPDVVSIQPVAGVTCYSNGIIKLVPQIRDLDGDTVYFTYSLSGPDISSPVTTTNGECAFGSSSSPLQNGAYTWTVSFMDNYGGSGSVSGTIQVDKSLPSAILAINDGSMYTYNNVVNLSITNATSDVTKIRLSNDGSNWQEFSGGNQTIGSWDLGTGDGKKTIYLQAYNQYGSWGPSAPMQSQIILDTVAPSVDDFKFLSNEGGADQVYFSWQGGSDSGGSGINSARLEQWNELTGSWKLLQDNYKEQAVTITADGCDTPVRFRIRLTDNAGNSSGWKEALAYTKASQGNIDLANTTSGYNSSDGHYIDLKLKLADGAKKYAVLCQPENGTGFTTLVDAGSLACHLTGLLGHGQYSFTVLTYNSNNEITEGSTGTVKVQNTSSEPLSGIGPVGLVQQNQNNTIRYTFDKTPYDVDGDTLNVTYFLSRDGKNYTSSTSSILSQLADGTYWWYATVEDGYGGKIQTDPVSFAVDTTAPVITVDNTSSAWAREQKVNIQAEDSGSGLASLQYKINEGTLVNYSGELDITTQGTNYLTVVATDKAGNTSTYAYIYFIDNTPPSGGSFQWKTATKTDGTGLAGSDQIPAQWTADDPETGIAQFKYAWSSSSNYDPNNLQTLLLLDQQSTFNNTFGGTFVDGQTYYLHIIPENYLGMQGPVIDSPQLLYDHTAPTVAINSLSGGKYFSSQYFLTGIEKLGVDLSTSDPDTGVSLTQYALIQKITGEEITWYKSLEDLKTNTKDSIVQGQIYYLAIQVANGTGLTAVAYSDPLIIDTTVPEITITTQSEQYDTHSFTGEIKASDNNTMVNKVEYCIGSAPGKADLSNGLSGADENGWFTVNYPAETLQVHQYASIPLGTEYYFTVKATNVAGLTGTKSSNGTVVTSSSVIAPMVTDDGTYASEANKLHFSWEFTNSVKSIKGYEYRVRSGAGAVLDWQFYDGAGAVSLIIPNLTLVNSTVYYCDVRARYDDGYSDIGSSDGIISDFTSPVINNLTVPNFSDGSGITLTWNAGDLESGVQCQLALGTSPGTADVTNGWVQVGGLKTFKLNQDSNGTLIQFVSGQKYYANLMVINGAGLTVEKNSQIPVIVDLTAPPVPVVLDEGKYSNHNDRLRASWKWSKIDPESGISEYQYTITEKRSLDGDEVWISNGLNKELEVSEVTVDGTSYPLELDNEQTYYIAVKAINKAGTANVGFSDGILIDTTKPDPPVVVDFGDYSLSATTLQATMKSSDAQSGVAGYQLSLGTLDNPQAIIDHQSVLSADGGVADFNRSDLSLQEGEIYFFTISATDNAGNISMESMSDGIMIDTKSPKITKITTPGRYLSDPTQLSFNWDLTDMLSGLAALKYAIGNNPSGSSLTWKNADLSGSMSLSGLNLSDGKTYYIYMKAQSVAQNELSPDLWSDTSCSEPITIDTTAPEVINITTPLDGQNSRHFLLQWEAQDAVSGISEYRYAIGSTRGGTDVTGSWICLVTNKTSISFYRDDFPLTQSKQYYISVTAKNGAGLWSEVYKSNAIVVDLTPPVITQVDYPSVYLRSRNAITGIVWSVNDPETGIQGYRIQAVLIKDGRSLDGAVTLTSQTAGIVNLTGLNLEEGKTYYIAMQFENGVGDWSGVKYSNGFVVDTVAPVAKITNPATEFVTNPGQLEIPYEVTEPGIIVIQLTAPNGKIETESVTVQDKGVYFFNQTLEGNYVLSLTPTDLAGNPGTTVTQIVRLNAKPVAVIGPDLVVTKGTVVHFKPEVSDSDGRVVQYQWDLGNGESSTEAAPSCAYKELGIYTVALVVTDNDGKFSEVARRQIKVTNTNSGELTMDENWYGVMEVSGDIVVPQGKVLTMMAGTQLTFTGNYQIKVFGKLVVDGTAKDPVTIGDTTTAWNSIRLENCDSGSQINYAIIMGASVGLVVHQSQASLLGCIFKNNKIGLHVLACNPVVQKNTFQENLIYGIKEDDGAAPT